MNLYELNEEHALIEQLLIESGGELTPEIEAALARDAECFEEKIGGYAHVIKNLEAEQQACAEEAKGFGLRARACKNSVERLKGFLLEGLTRRNLKQLGRVKRQASGPHVEILDPMKVAIGFVRKSEIELDKKAILDYWKATGEAPSGTAIVRGEHIRIGFAKGVRRD